MSSIGTSSGSIKPKRPGTNKRIWTFDEETKLVETLLELHNTGRFKAERGFKPGHFNAVEDGLKGKLPNSGIKAKPHIESKVRNLKANFGVVHDMLAGCNCSGFGWDSDRKCITAENAVWDEYLKSHSDAEPFRFKSSPFYEELCIVFGKDRATGKDAETAADIMEELEKQTMNEANENEVSSIPIDSASFFETTKEGSKVKRSKSESISSLARVIKDSASIISMKIGKASDKLSRALEDGDAHEKRLIINSELTKLSGLSMRERHQATRKIGCDRETTDIFFTIPDDEKEIWVKSLLSGDI